MEMKQKSCSFFGHRNIEITQELEKKIYNFVENLIVNCNVKIFLFGSRSDFDFLCHEIVTRLKEKYPNIKRIGYTCKGEGVTLEKDRVELEKMYSYFEKREVHLLGVEEEYEHKTKYSSGRAAYVERNQSMIDDSDYCLFFYDINYLPPTRKLSKHNFCNYQPKSGTALAYKYAKNKKRIIKNFYEN